MVGLAASFGGSQGTFPSRDAPRHPVHATAGGDCAGGSCGEPIPAATIRSRTPESDAAAAITNFF
jgi:hypothetical protein